MSDIAVALGQQIRTIRNLKAISMERLAELAGLSPTYISEVERGRKGAGVQTLIKIAVALDVRLSDITAPVEPARAEKLSKFEVLARLERGMQEFYTEAEADTLVSLLHGASSQDRH